jgi:hypothetical protein
MVIYTTSADFSLKHLLSPFHAHGETLPREESHTFIAQPPHHLRRLLALVTRASLLHARSPRLAAPSMRFLFIGSRTLHASFPHLVAVLQLRFTILAVTSLWEVLLPRNAHMLWVHKRKTALLFR